MDTADVWAVVIVGYDGDWIAAGEQGQKPMDLIKRWNLDDHPAWDGRPRKVYMLRAALEVPPAEVVAEKVDFSVYLALDRNGTPEHIVEDLLDREGGDDVDADQACEKLEAAINLYRTGWRPPPREG